MNAQERELGRLRSQLVDFLKAEEAFVEQVRSAVSRIGRHPVGRLFSQEDVDGMIALRASIGRRSQHRAELRSMMSQVTGVRNEGNVTISALISVIPELSDLKEQCDQIRNRTLQGYTNLQLVLGQLRESHAIISVVLDAALGSQTDSSRYDSSGRPVVKPGLVENRRVA